jgi:spermidine synthase
MSKNSKILILTITLAFCSMAYELLLANTLSIITSDYIFWHSMTIGVYLGGLGVGSFFQGKKENPYHKLFKVEIGLSLIGSLSVILLYSFAIVYLTSDYLSFASNNYVSASYLQNNFLLKALFFITSQIITFAVGLLSGMEVPLLMNIYKNENDDNNFYPVIGINYIGTLVGTLVYALILLPKLDTIYSSVAIGLLNLIASIFLISKTQFPKKYLAFILSSLLIIPLVFVSLYGPGIHQLYLKSQYLFSRTQDIHKLDAWSFFKNHEKYPYITRKKTLYQNIDYFEYNREKGSEEFVLSLDNHFQFSSLQERFYHEAFVHVPFKIIGEIPKKVIVLGGGDGLLIRELLEYKEIEEIIHIELDQGMLEIASEHPVISKLNQGSLKNPRVKTIITDAFHYLRNTKEQYKSIFIDFPYPKNYNLSKLYSTEFYRFVHRALAPDGFVVMDAPLYNKVDYNKNKFRGRYMLTSIFTPSHKKNNSIIMSTIYYSGFTKLFPYKVNEESFLLFSNRKKDYNYKVHEGDLSIFKKVKASDLQQILGQFFPHQIRKNFVNSIFRPLLIHHDF